MSVSGRGFALDLNGDVPPPPQVRLTCPCGWARKVDATAADDGYDRQIHEAICADHAITVEEL